MEKQLKVQPVVWFSQYFGVHLAQYELPFVDFNLYSDVPLFIDPYAITKDESKFAAECHNAIVSYFQCLLDAIRERRRVSINRLIRGRLSEPNEIHLGVGKTARGGRGIGNEQEQLVVDALTRSEAARVGVIQAIQELELHIPGIGPDKISDLVANIILSQLSRFTEIACEEYGIATRPCAVSGFWNQERMEWDGGYFNLPVRETDDYILVPKRFVRLEKDLMNHREFYDKYILDVLERELIDANDSLVQTLKSGQRRIYKKDMREDPRFSPTKEFISQFIMAHPDVIDNYRSGLRERFAPADPAFWSGKSDEDDPAITDALLRLDEIRPGRSDAKEYHEVAFSLLKFVFDWALENFEIEYQMDEGRGRIDVIADNFANGGLFSDLRSDFNARSIPIECKNYTADLGNDEFNQLSDRLGLKTSRFGMLLCRTVTDYELMLKHRTDRWLRQDNMILLFDDNLLKRLVHLRLERDVDLIQGLLRRLMREVEYGGQSRIS